ncbi:hypothetical protein C922_03638 [Plasmodium inui San Antonio 1]|uniref:Uncharacterized protein n=1 Tax=Plasmodium inui San Antonio 1 TaxID=1237626 RepID=W7A9T8_9APIC|nr:hypothetical protein C922_03638 [Plasmodium inui San Antonio 1]EUD65914.1 hypothetical protein C922_03638 [Plasmodium inui San Antonio 1]
MDSTNIKQGLSNENSGVPDTTLKTEGGTHSAEVGEVTPSGKRAELDMGVDTVECGIAKDAQSAQRQKGQKGSVHGESHKRESGLTDDQRSDRKKSQGQSEIPTPRSDVEFHKLYESDDNNIVSPRNSSTSESLKKEELDKESKKKKKNNNNDNNKNNHRNNMMLNTTMLQSYINRSYDKVSSAFIKTSKSLLKRTSNIGYSERGRDVKGGSSDGVDAGSKVEKARARLLRSCLTGTEKRVETHAAGDKESASDDLSACHEPDENDFFTDNFDLINKTLREDNRWGEENKERMMGKCKNLLNGNDAAKLYNKIDDLYEERILLVKYINYYMDINEKHQRELQKIQTSYDILLTENEQLSQNNITLKRHIDLLRTGDTRAQE